jgi:tRNA A-37 threonylcarbamoyl transferase component Bud32
VSRRRWPEPPAGFVLRSEGASALYVAEPLEDELRKRQLSRWAEWDLRLAAGESATGRGATAVVSAASGPPWRLKRMRRGGHAARIWRDRYPSTERLVATLAASVEVLARGVPTARPVALMLESGTGTMVRGAMAFEEIVDSEDLAHRVGSGQLTRDELTAAIGTVRVMHDRGIVHPDLNLGNVLLRSTAGGPPEVFVIDLDRASFADGPLDFQARQAAVRRLERSCAKLTGQPGPLGAGSEDLWYDLYAGRDAELQGRFASGRRAGRFKLALHRLGWRRSSP